MSEAQKEEFVTRTEKALSGLEKQKPWLRYAAFACQRALVLFFVEYIK